MRPSAPQVASQVASASAPQAMALTMAASRSSGLEPTYSPTLAPPLSTTKWGTAVTPYSSTSSSASSMSTWREIGGRSRGGRGGRGGFGAARAEFDGRSHRGEGDLAHLGGERLAKGRQLDTILAPCGAEERRGVSSGRERVRGGRCGAPARAEVEHHSALVEAVDGLEKALSVVVLVHMAVAIADQEIPENLGVGDVVVDKGNLEVLAHFNRSCRF